MANTSHTFTYDKITYIYTLSCPITSEVRYVGKSDNPQERLNKHQNNLNNTKYKTPKWSWIKSLRDKGFKPTMQVIDIVPNSEWCFWEQHYISLYKSWGFNLTNMTSGGNGGFSVSLESRRKMSESQKRYNASLLSPRKMPPKTKEARLKISKAHKNNPKSEAHLAKIRQKVQDSGVFQSMDFKDKISQINKKRACCPEWREKLSIISKKWHQENPYTNEKRKEVSIRLKNYWKDRQSEFSKPVDRFDLNWNLIKSYKSTKEAGRDGFSVSHISSCAKGKRKTHAKSYWKYSNK